MVFYKGGQCVGSSIDDGCVKVFEDLFETCCVGIYNTEVLDMFWVCLSVWGFVGVGGTPE